MYKLYTAKHNTCLHHQINIGSVIHNHCIALHKKYYFLYRKYLSPHRLKAHIAKCKKLPKYAWWSALGSQAIQDIIERIDRGYQRFFQNLKDRKDHKTTKTIGPPTLRDRVWTCACGVSHQRDHNAAINIFREGASSLGGSHVRLAAASNGC
jgi:transposase